MRNPNMETRPTDKDKIIDVLEWFEIPYELRDDELVGGHRTYRFDDAGQVLSIEDHLTGKIVRGEG